ncbi:MAG: thiamine pyrophosphate-requiring protein [Acidimicrobiia bacterium]|nr:thiamine pyrophosphate-requiring protein [Acidimicrobiia bacterium]
MKRQVKVESTADAYLELLTARGVEYLFGNGGTDFGPLIDAYARRLEQGDPCPQPVTVPHEIVAVSMAHGHAMVTGRPQAVMVHTVAGTANAIGGLINANRSQVPMFFSAGRTPLTEGDLRGARDMHIHWAQESFDQGSMAREWVKWDYELRHGADLEGVVDRALAICASEPYGPVYLTLPREVLAEDRDTFDYDERPRQSPSVSVAAPESIAEVAALLVGARNPIIITRSAGKDPAAVPALTRLAEALAIPVFDPYPTHVNMAHTHGLYQATDPSAALADADVVVVIESDVPWTPKRQGPATDATVVAVGADPLFARYPVRGFAAHVCLAGSTARNLSALADAVGAAAAGVGGGGGAGAARAVGTQAVGARQARWQAEHERLIAAADGRAEAGRAASGLDKAWVSACMEELRTPDTIVVNELGFDTAQLRFSEPGTFFGVSGAGVLGWGTGAALGAKLAAPERTVVACIGDGSYLFGAPSTAHWLSRKMDLPVLYLVWNNAQWGAVRGATRMVYPNGWAVKTGDFPFSDLGPALDLEMICQSAGGYGERVEDPAEVPAALERALKAVQVEGRQAVLNLVAH